MATTLFTQLSTLHWKLQAVPVQVAEIQQQCTQYVNHLQFMTTHSNQHDDNIVALMQELHALYTAAAGQLTVQQNEEAKFQADVTKASGSKDLVGPCNKSLEPVLSIKCHVYNGGAFIGTIFTRP